MPKIQNFPDVNLEKQVFPIAIDHVGISDLVLPVRLSKQVKEKGNISLFVSLNDPGIRGIHMSRLYFILHEYFANNTVHFSGLKQLLLSSIKSQKGISQSGKIRVESNWLKKQKSLKSQVIGWRHYPFYFEVNYSKKEGTFQYIAGGEVLYSSTCPCSTALSQQIIAKDFEKKFSKKKNLTKKNISDYINQSDFLKATPHSQKSKAFFKIQLREKAKNSFSFLKTVQEIEKALGTPVQTAVKREDEAEFARLNAQNLMFCEDAVRRIGSLFKKNKNFADYLIRVQHYESLHPFTVESVIAKGIKGGWKA